MSIHRRSFLKTAATLAATATALRNGALGFGESAMAAALGDSPYEEPQSFNENYVIDLAHQLAREPFKEEKITLPPSLANLNYDQYRDIRYDLSRSLWRGEPHGFSVDPFHTGFYFKNPVNIYMVDNDTQAKLKYDPSLFIFGPSVTQPEGKPDLPFAGFRLRYPLNTPDYFDEFCVFQGASYFRAIGKGLLYGLSARGLAVNVGGQGGEEFPFFKTFWLRKPQPASGQMIVYALLDSPSVTGAYKFTIIPGETTQMDVEAQIFPRRNLPHIGIAPLTSMFLFSAMNRSNFRDFRPAVADSDGLMMHSGAGEWIWRPLSNRRQLQVSAFQDRNPRGFGLMQRARKFEDYFDLEASYERRPSLWVEPIGEWDEGAIELYEIPSSQEIHDNMVALWRPKAVLNQGAQYSYNYRLYWCANWPNITKPEKAPARFSGTGLNLNGDRQLFVIEFAAEGLNGDATGEITASAGTLSNVVVQNNPFTKAQRLSFELDPGEAATVELRACLKQGEEQVSETWLFRWVKS